MPSEPVSENILADLKSTFEGITADATTWTTVRKAYIGDGVPVAEHVEPAVYITATYTDMDGEGETLVEAIRHILFVEAKLILRTRDENESTQLERFIGDAIKAVYADTTRGGNAVKTIIEDVDRSQPGPFEGVIMAVMRMRVTFRTSTADLATSF